jgi:secreted trypsin-like serine protease
MTYIRNLMRGLLAVLALALMLPAPSQALTARDTQEINSYVLTDAGLARYVKAIKALGPIAKNMSNDCDDEDDSDTQSIDQMVARVNSVAGAKAALQSAGMTPREYVIFTMSIFQTGIASWGLTQPGGKLPPGVSTANVNFYRKNEAAMTKLGESVQSDDCDAGDAEDDGSQ